MTQISDVPAVQQPVFDKQKQM